MSRSTLIFWIVLTGLVTRALEAADLAGPPVDLGSGVVIRNAEQPFNYFSNPWTVVGLKDYPAGTRISPGGELLLADGLVCRPLVGEPMVMLDRRAVPTLQDDHLPIVRLDFTVNDSVRHEIEILACPLPGSVHRYDWLTADSYLNLVRVTFTNVGGGSATAGFGFDWLAPEAAIRPQLQPGIVERLSAVVAGERLLAMLQTPTDARTTAAGTRTSVTVPLAAGAATSVVAAIPYRSLGDVPAAVAAIGAIDFGRHARATASFWSDLLARGATLEVPEAKVADTWRASLVYEFIGRDAGEFHAGEGFYDNLYIRDSAYQAIALAQAGFPDAAREGLEWFLRSQHEDGRFSSQLGQLDANGYALWAFVEYSRLTGDNRWLQRVYPAIVRSVRWIQQARRGEQDENSPFFGILPAAVADGEFLWHGRNHIIGYDWQNLRGVQAAAYAARVLGHEKEAEEFTAEFEDYRRCILRALDRAGRDSIPPSYEGDGTHWGNLECVFPTLLIDPGDPRLTRTLQIVRHEHRAADAAKSGFFDGVIQWTTPHWGATHPYMSQFVTNTHIVRGEYAEAVDGFYSFLLHTTSTHGFPEGVFPRRRQAWSNTLPHLWAAAMYITTLRNMVVRELDDELHLLSCAPGHWLAEGKRVRFLKAPTHFGPVSLTVTSSADGIEIQLDPPRRGGPHRIVIHMPAGIEITSASVADQPVKAEPTLLTLDPGTLTGPTTVKLKVERAPAFVPVTFASKVAAFEADPAHTLAPIPHLAPWPGAATLKEGDCTPLDLSSAVTAQPFVVRLDPPQVAGVPFKLVDPAAHGGRGLVVLNGGGAFASQPAEVEIPASGQGRLLCVLGNVGASVGHEPGPGEGGALAEYEIRYADGTSQRVPLIASRTIDNWNQPFGAVEVVPGVWGNGWHLNLLAIHLEPKRLKSVVFRDLGTPAAPVVAAMTVVKK